MADTYLNMTGSSSDCSQSPSLNFIPAITIGTLTYVPCVAINLAAMMMMNDSSHIAVRRRTLSGAHTHTKSGLS